MAIPRLRPCPFCGETESLLIEARGRFGYVVMCGICGAIGPERWDEQWAAERWNNQYVLAARLSEEG